MRFSLPLALVMLPAGPLPGRFFAAIRITLRVPFMFRYSDPRAKKRNHIGSFLLALTDGASRSPAARASGSRPPGPQAQPGT
jgi:hypothetical protein